MDKEILSHSRSNLNSGQQEYLCTCLYHGHLSSILTNWLQSSHSEMDAAVSDTPHAFPRYLDFYEIYGFLIHLRFLPSLGVHSWCILNSSPSNPFILAPLPRLSCNSHYWLWYVTMTLRQGLIKHVMGISMDVLNRRVSNTVLEAPITLMVIWVIN